MNFGISSSLKPYTNLVIYF